MGFWNKLLYGTKEQQRPHEEAARLVVELVRDAPFRREPLRPEPTGPVRTPARPVGSPVGPWASSSNYVSLVGESFYKKAFRAIFKERGLTLTEDGRELPDAAAHLAIDPSNPYDETAVAVWISGHHVGYLSRDTGAEYFPVLAELADEGRHLCVGARVWAYAHEDGDLYASGGLQLPPRNGVQPFNQFPAEPHVVIPPGRLAIQVTGEEEHMDVLGQYLADHPRYLAVTLHGVTEAKTPRSTPYEGIEVRLDGQRVGVLTKTMSAHIRALVDHIDSHGKIAVCRGVLKGSPLQAELTLDVARSAEVTSQWLESIA